MAETITEDGEIITDTDERFGNLVLTPDTSVISALARAEIDIQIETARKYRRSLTLARSNIMTLATLDEETAEGCCYALVRGKANRNKDKRSLIVGASEEKDKSNRPIEGPSIRLAEIAAQSWGNNRSGARVVAVNKDERWLESEGAFHDLETNVANAIRVRRSIRKTDGGVYSDDMIAVTGNAANSIAKRNAILGGIPRGVYWPSYLAARSIICGTVQTLVVNREKTYKAFASFGITPAQIFELLEVGGDADIGLDQIAQLRAVFASIRNNETTIEEAFGRGSSGSSSSHHVVKDPLKGEDSTSTQADITPAYAAHAKVTDLTGFSVKRKDRDIYAAGDTWLILSDPQVVRHYDGTNWMSQPTKAAYTAASVQQDGRDATAETEQAVGDQKPAARRGRPPKDRGQAADEQKPATATAAVAEQPAATQDKPAEPTTTIDRLAASVKTPLAMTMADLDDDEPDERSIRNEPLQQQKVSKPLSKEELAGIKTAREYAAYARMVIEAAPFQSRSEMLDWWKSERRARLELHDMTDDILEPLKVATVNKANQKFPDHDAGA